MPVAPTSILRALQIRVGENRTTALLAVACQFHRAFAEALLRRALNTDDLILQDIEGVNVELAIVRGRRIDLELVARTSAGLFRVWFESKWTAGFGRDQLKDYAEALRDQSGGLGTLIALLPAERADALEPVGYADVVTWDEVALLADRAGTHAHHRSAYATPWRSAARDAGAPASQHVLDLFLQHLEEEHSVTVHPLTSLHASALRQARSAIVVTDKLAEGASQRAGWNLDRQRVWSHQLGCRWVIHSPENASDEGRWWAGHGSFVLWRSITGNADLHPANGASFAAGVQIRTDQADAFDAVIEALCADDRATDWPWPLRRASDESWRYVCSALPMEAIATAAGNFDGQVRFVQMWLERTLTSLTDV